MAKDKQKEDQYYTPDDLAKEYTKKFLEFIGNEEGLIIEPSAGTGAFIRGLLNNGVPEERIVAYDLEPKCEGFNVIQKNFYEVKEKEVSPKFAIGNPPFGKGGSEAIKFMNRCAKLGVTKLGFINPSCVGNKFFTDSQLWKGWKPVSIDEHWFPDDKHFVLDNNEQYGEKENPVNCIFQLWEYDPKYTRETRPSETECEDFEILHQGCTKVEIDGKQCEVAVSGLGADLVMYTHGKNAGKVVPYEDGIHKANVKCFLKLKEGKTKDQVVSKIESTDWNQIKKFSTIKHNPSLSPAEIIYCYKVNSNAKSN